MNEYTDELKLYLAHKGIDIAKKWELNGRQSLNLKEEAQIIAKKYGVKWGALGDRLRNIVWLESNGRNGRNIKYAPSWVETFYMRAKINKV